MDFTEEAVNQFIDAISELWDAWTSHRACQLRSGRSHAIDDNGLLTNLQEEIALPA